MLAGLLVLLPILPPQTQANASWATTSSPGLVAVDAPWAKLTSEQLSGVMGAAQRSRLEFRVLTVNPEQGEQDGTALARSLGIERFPVLLEIRDGQARVVPWHWY